ncbi:MAG: CHAT domain-containing protein [Acidobacteriota bacterium]
MLNRRKALTDVQPLEAESLQREFLDEKTTLVAYFVAPQRVFAWVLDREKLVKVNLAISPQRLARQVASWKWNASNCMSLSDRRCEQAENYSRRLYSKLIEPLIPNIRHRHLIFIPHRDLHDLSFAALMNSEGRYLIEDFVVSSAASASILPLLGNRSGNAGTDLLVAGNPVAKDLPSLWAAEEEALAVAQLLSTTPLLGMQATESAVRERAQAGKLALLHLAAFGQYEKETPQFSGVALTPDERNDGDWEVHEIMEEANLQGVRLVVLSACWTAAGEPTGGDDVISLTRAFLAAGSPAVLSTLWSFNDDFPSAEFMTHFYSRLLSGSTSAEALRSAQLALLKQEKYRAPYYWAGYTLYGDPQSGWQ